MRRELLSRRVGGRPQKKSEEHLQVCLRVLLLETSKSNIFYHTKCRLCGTTVQSSSHDDTKAKRHFMTKNGMMQCKRESSCIGSVMDAHVLATKTPPRTAKTKKRRIAKDEIGASGVESPRKWQCRTAGKFIYLGRDVGSGPKRRLFKSRRTERKRPRSALRRNVARSF